MARFHDVTLDARHPASIARFWAAALDGYEVAPYDDDELAALRAKGIDDPEDDPNVLVQPTAGGAPRLFFQLVPEGKTVKNRVHLDLRVGDLDAEVARLESLGAQLLWSWPDGNGVTLADPEGNELCLQRD